MTSADIAVEKPGYWDTAVAELVQRDRILGRLIPPLEASWLASRNAPFVTLARALVGQQASTQAAQAAWQRLAAECGRQPSSAAVVRLGQDGLRACGLSQRKAEYLLDLAVSFSERRVRPDRWQAMDDEGVVAELMSIRGIGRWTAQMFLIFNLQRPDVLPLDDPGLLKAISQHYFSGEPVSRFEAREVSQAWQPWRTVATWYLWRSLDPADAGQV